MTQENKNIQPQAEPYIVKSHDIHIDNDYADWIADIKNRYRSAQVKAAVKVNAEKLLFNWQLGRDLVQKKAEERWGAGVVEQVSLDLNREFPDSTNFSVRNLWYMKQWYLFYAENPEKLKQLVSVMLPDDSLDKKINQIADEEFFMVCLRNVIYPHQNSFLNSVLIKREKKRSNFKPKRKWQHIKSN